MPSLRGAEGDEAIQKHRVRPLDCFASLAMTLSPALGDNIGCQLVVEEGQSVAQEEFALLQPLNLQLVAFAHEFQRINGGIEIAVFLAQARRLGLESGPVFVTQSIGHAPELPSDSAWLARIPPSRLSAIMRVSAYQRQDGGGQETARAEGGCRADKEILNP